MPPRLNKRQQRELEELEALSTPTKVQEESSDEELDTRPSGRSAGPGIFATASLLAQENDDDDDEGSDGADTGPVKKLKKGKKKKKKKPALKAQPVIVDDEGSKTSKPDQVQILEQALSPSERKALKKAKQKEKKKAETDDIDQALAELSIKLPTAQQNLSQQTTSKGHGLPDLLGVSLQHLDSEAELRKFFGSRVVQASKASSSSPGGAAGRRNVAALRSNLTRPQPTWWNASQREGLTIRSLTEDEIEEKLARHNWQPVNEKWWTVEYSKKYKSMTREFLRTVMSGDPEGFWELIRRLPWHADTLLQLSEVYRHREEHAQAVDFVDRALFTYERSFIGAFNLTSGLNRLDFDRVENRPFYLAIHRQVVDLQRRGCVRTGFEFARLLYSLDPWTDPHGALLYLDYVSIKANMSQWLLDVYEIFERRRDVKDTRLNPSLLPGWAYSRALALRILEKGTDHVASTAALVEAINDFPSIVPLLADKLDISLPALIRGHPECKIETDAIGLSYAEGILHLLTHLYVQRAFQVWKDPEYTNWFNDTTTSVFTSLPSPITALPVTPRRKIFLNLYESDTLRYSVYRHIIVLESSYRRLFSFIPKYVFDGRSLACDPLPPKTAITNYDGAFFERVPDLYSAFSRTRSRRERAVEERRLAQMVPDAAFRQQLQGFFEGQGLANQFPGGIVQFAQMLAQLQPAEVEALMLNGILDDPQGAMDFAGFGFGAPGMPGQMPREDMLGGFNADGGVGGIDQQDGEHPQGVVVGANDDDNEEDEDEEDEDEDEEDDEEDYSPMPRMIRNVLRRLWGGNARVVEESSSEDEQPPPPPQQPAYNPDWDGVD